MSRELTLLLGNLKDLAELAQKATAEECSMILKQLKTHNDYKSDESGMNPAGVWFFLFLNPKCNSYEVWKKMVDNLIIHDNFWQLMAPWGKLFKKNLLNKQFYERMESHPLSLNKHYLSKVLKQQLQLISRQMSDEELTAQLGFFVSVNKIFQRNEELRLGVLVALLESTTVNRKAALGRIFYSIQIMMETRQSSKYIVEELLLNWVYKQMKNLSNHELEKRVSIPATITTTLNKVSSLLDDLKKPTKMQRSEYSIDRDSAIKTYLDKTIKSKPLPISDKGISIDIEGIAERVLQDRLSLNK